MAIKIRLFGTIVLMKRVLKAFVLFIASTTYAWLLFMTASGVAMRQTLADPVAVKSWLANSNVYSNIVDEVSKLATIQQKQNGSLVQITSDDIRLTARDAFTAEGLQQDGEKVIDGFYGWFRGQTTGPEFSVDFAARQATFAKLMRAKLESKIQALPECASASKFVIDAFDPFKADCRPKGVDLTTELDSFEKEIASSKSIVPFIKFSGDDIKIRNNTGQNDRVGAVFVWVPTAYKALVWGPYLLAVLTVVSGLTMIFMSTSRRKGFRRFAGGLIFTGLILIVSGFFLRPAFEKLNGYSTKLLGGQASFTQKIVDPIFYQANRTFSRYSIIFGFGYVIPAVLIYGVLIITRPHKEPDLEGEHAATYQDHIQSHAQPPEPAYAPTDQSTGPQLLPLQNNPPQSRQEMPAQQEPIAAQANVPTPIIAPRAQPSSRPVTRRQPMIQG